MIDPELDLVLEKTVDVPPESLWQAWSQPAHLMPWFCPKPWTTVDCEIDLRPGGIFRTVMQSPEGQKFPNLGCYLEIVPNRKLVWTDMLEPGFRPARQKADEHCPVHCTVTLLLEPDGAGTKYTAIAMHPNVESRAKHEQMGFQEGWGIVLDQLVEYVKQTDLR
jgi:uncharacterized protein YndB with AHSA1/START domain